VQDQREFKGDKARKIAQFATVFHMLQQGRPMLEYESMRDLFGFLKMPHLSKKHWSNNSGWLMAEYLHSAVMRRARNVLGAAKYIAVTCDEVTTVDNQFWLSIHAYTINNFYRSPILVSLERVLEGASSKALASAIVDALVVYVGLRSHDLVKKFVSCGADGASVFQVQFYP
jgi:hypothetical protein